jgi:ABC-type multidrug transport system ATPase subunit
MGFSRSGNLAQEWMAAQPDHDGIYYADGHARVYHGKLASLPRRYVARQKLCLRGTTDYWINALVGQFDLEALRNMKCGALSSGEQTRVALAKAMRNQPHLLLLDEPTVSLDPSAAREIRARVRDLAVSGGVGVLWTSHNMYEVQDVCDRVLFLVHGEILLEGDPKILPGEEQRYDFGLIFPHRGLVIERNDQ